MNIQLAKKYKTRNGSTVFIKRFDETDNFPWFGNINKINGEFDRLGSFKSNGKYVGSSIQSPYDILEEIESIENKYTTWLYENRSIGNGHTLVRYLEDMETFSIFLKDNDLPEDTELA